MIPGEASPGTSYFSGFDLTSSSSSVDQDYDYQSNDYCWQTSKQEQA
jgi:hypothetical protein